MSSFFLYGPPGGGKTTLAASMSKANFIPLIIDLDRKARTMENLKPLIAAKAIQVHDFKSMLTEASFLERVTMGPNQGPVSQPQGYLELAEIITNLEEKPPKDHLQLVPVLDNLTRTLEHMKRWLFHLQKRNVISLPDYGTILTNLEELYDSFFGLQVPRGDKPALYPHVIMIAHDKLEKNDLSGEILLKPLIDGQMRDKSGSSVDEMYYCSVEVGKDGSAEYIATTKPVDQVSQARTSRNLETYVEQDFGEILKGEYYVEAKATTKSSKRKTKN